MFKMMMTAALAVATLGVPALAQTTGSGSMGGSGTQSGSMGSGSMGTDQSGMQTGSMGNDGAMAAPAPRMTRAQMASMRRCQAMSHERMMKNRTCMKMHAAHPEMVSPGM